MNIAAYLDRIGYQGSTAPTPEVLRGIHRAHLLTVPFENLDIGRGRKIALDEEAFVRKIVAEHRGGFCYELNGAFAALLRSIGFPVNLLSARVARADGSLSPEFDHLTLLVQTGGERWLADVGFGDLFLEPLLLAPGVESRQSAEKFCIRDEGSSSLAVERALAGGPWHKEYIFNLQPRELEEFAGMCHFHQTSPDSHFTRNRICSMATAQGRITLTNDKWIVTSDGIRKESLLATQQEWLDTLRARFGITLP